MQRVIAAAVFLTSFASRLMAAEPQPPDLTNGGTKDTAHDWTLGPTGARGWIWGRDLETTEARQILITEAEKGSPCDGVLAPGDVILGIDGKVFDGDARKAFGRAITTLTKEAQVWMRSDRRFTRRGHGSSRHSPIRRGW